MLLGLVSGLYFSPAGRRFIRSYMPEQHRAFYATLENIFVCVRDEGGMPRAMALTGRAGFIHSPSPTELVISSQQAVDPGSCPAWQIYTKGPYALLHQATVKLSSHKSHQAQGLATRCGEG